MHIDQRRVVTVNLHDGKAQDFVLSRDAAGCRLSIVSKEDVLTIHLSVADLHKLRQKLGGVEKEVLGNSYALHEPVPLTHAAGHTWTSEDWLAFN